MPRGNTSRRSYLTVLGSTAALALSGGAIGASSGRAQQQESTAREEGFSNVVDVVEAGADDTGNQSVNPVLEDLRANDTLLKFPEGTYLLTDSFRFTDFENFGLYGENATFRIAPYQEFDAPVAFKLGVSYAPGNNLLFEGFTFDQRGQNRGVRAIQATVANGLRVRDILVRGEDDTPGPCGGSFNVTSRHGYGIVERFRVPDGAVPMRTEDDRPYPGRTGINSSRYHVGTLWYRDCVVNSFHDNGMYVRGGGGIRTEDGGQVHVEGGRYRNNNVSNIRIGGDGSTIRNVTVQVDENQVGDLNQRGIRVDHGEDVLVENAEINLPEPNGDALTVLNEVDSATVVDTDIFVGDDPSRAISVSPETGPVQITDTHVHTVGPSAGGPALHLPDGGLTDHAEVTVDDFTVTGDASGDDSSRENVIANRDNCTFRNVTIDQPGRGLRQGINVGGRNCHIVDSELTSRHHPVVVRGEVRIINSELYTEGPYRGIRFYEGSEGTLVDNVIEGGVRDSGADRITRRGNEYV